MDRNEEELVTNVINSQNKNNEVQVNPKSPVETVPVIETQNTLQLTVDKQNQEIEKTEEVEVKPVETRTEELQEQQNTIKPEPLGPQQMAQMGYGMYPMMFPYNGYGKSLYITINKVL